MRFSDLERAIPKITQKMLGQQLRSLVADGIVVRTALQVPPKVEYCLTRWGSIPLSYADAILKWADRRPAEKESATRADTLLLLNNGQTRTDASGLADCPR